MCKPTYPRPRPPRRAPTARASSVCNRRYLLAAYASSPPCVDALIAPLHRRPLPPPVTHFREPARESRTTHRYPRAASSLRSATASVTCRALVRNAATAEPTLAKFRFRVLPSPPTERGPVFSAVLVCVRTRTRTVIDTPLPHRPRHRTELLRLQQKIQQL